MKISELIAELERLKIYHGDLPVIVDRDGSFEYLSISDPAYDKKARLISWTSKGMQSEFVETIVL